MPSHFFLAVFLLLASFALSYLTTTCQDVHFTGTKPDKLKPVVLLGGIGGNALEKKLTRAAEPFGCFKNTNWELLYVNIFDMIPHLSGRCFVQNMKLDFNSTSRTYSNMPGVHIRGKDYGGVEGLIYMSPTLKKDSCYMQPLVSYFQQGGYEVQKNLFGATYDWRLCPSEWQRLLVYESLKRMIEFAYETNRNQSVVLLAHSMGVAHGLYFLESMEEDWKQKYIERYVSVSGPFDGSWMTLAYMVAGTGFGLPVNVREVARRAAGMQWMVPSVLNTSQPFLTITESAKSYSINTLEQMWKDIWESEGHPSTESPNPWLVYSDVQSRSPLINVVPNVPVKAIHGRGLKTPSSFKMKKFSENKFDIAAFVDGDGLVPFDSLDVVSSWGKLQKEKVEVKMYDGMDHLMFVMHQNGVEYVWSAVYDEFED